MNNPELTWVKSSYSSQGNCVEVAAHDRMLRFTPAAWRRFADRVKHS
jgi:hypothetical protein